VKRILHEYCICIVSSGLRLGLPFERIFALGQEMCLGRRIGLYVRVKLDVRWEQSIRIARKIPSAVARMYGGRGCSAAMESLRLSCETCFESPWPVFNCMSNVFVFTRITSTCNEQLVCLTWH
jgi:hypothetical protein